MNKTYKALAVATLLASGLAQAVAINVGASTGARQNMQALDSAGKTYWRIKNYSDNTLKVESDLEIMTLEPGDEGKLNRGGSFDLTVNGRSFKTTDNVVAFYNNDAKVLTIGTYRRWNPNVGFRFGIFAGPRWGYYSGYRRSPGLGFGFGVGSGWGGGYRGGWHRGYRRW